MTIINTDRTKETEWVMVYKDNLCYVHHDNHYQQTSCEGDEYKVETFTTETNMENRIISLGLTHVHPENEE